MVVILDIGAGSKSFAYSVINMNPWKNLLFFCGEPDWREIFTFGDEDFHFTIPFKKISNRKARELVSKNKTGIHRINSEYSSFKFEDESLDMVTVNSPHPLYPTTGIEEEIDRCLKSGGVFYFGHSMVFSLDLPNGFELIAEKEIPTNFFSELTLRSTNLKKIIDDYPSNLPNNIPASPTILYSTKEHIRQKRTLTYKSPGGTSYLYNSIPLYPNFKVWIKK